MPHGFFEVPDWFAWENQGAGLALASLGGQACLVVMMVDHPGDAPNRGAYRIGRNVVDTGEVKGGWTDWIDIPGWFSWENQGADIAVADLAGSGGQDLVVFMIDNPPGANRGVFRIGQGLAFNGAVGNWTGWIDVDNWPSWENQGGGIAVTPPDGAGRRDLVVFAIDNPVGPNKGLYRVGRGLTRDGAITGGWTGWQEVPGWFSWENQGGGIAVTGRKPNGKVDLVAFQIDNAMQQGDISGLNQAFFLTGTDLADDGRAGWQTDWLGIPHWFSWENQYGGIQIATLGGRRKLLCLAVDNPPGQNSGFYTALDLDQPPAMYGRWQQMPFHSGVLAVHSAVLPGGDVLFFAGSGSSRKRFEAPQFGDIAAGVATSVVWKPDGNNFTHPPTLRTPDGKPFDLFCGGDTFLADGRMLSAGGTKTYGDFPMFTGRADACIFDWRSATWTFTGTMGHARWYPTLITLADGKVLATTGLDQHGGDTSRANVDIYDPAHGTWAQKHFVGTPGLPLYAHLFQLANGNIFFAGGRMDDGLPVQPFLFDLAHEPMGTVPVNDLLDPVRRNQSASVLLPPVQDQRVMVCGGGPVEKEDKTHATGQVSIADMKAAAPNFVAAMPMCLPRMHLNTVLLPDRTVFVSGGSLKQEDEPLARLQAELFDPATGEWRLMATAGVARLYHSTAVLLMDGRVVAAGGNPEGGKSVKWEPPDPKEEMRLEIFSPPYLFRGPRPAIGAAPDHSGYGAVIDIATPDANGIVEVSLIRNCVTTHSFDGSQRLVDLPISARGAGKISVRMPPDGRMAPPGWYMLFLLNTQRVPSVGHWLRLG